jgi:NAD(P)-dependent dehydrogenase (short-subunit alcohol dehydrogenase family)
VLINNAGVIMVGPVDHMNGGDFEEAMARILGDRCHTMLAAIPHMRQNGGGRIVNISSIGGKIACRILPRTAPASSR